MSILQSGLDQLTKEVSGTDGGKVFPILRQNLVVSEDRQSYESLAEQTGLTQDAIKGMIYRWRKRFREIVKNEVQATLTIDGDLELEMKYLVDCLSHAYRSESPG